MLKGGSSISPRSAQIFRFAEIFIPIVLVMYGVFIQFNIVRTPHAVDSFGFYIFSFWWVYLCILQYIFPVENKVDSALRLIAFHLLTGAYLIFISGVFSPFVGCWLILMIASYVNFSDLGLQISTLSFVVVVAVDIILWHFVDPSLATRDLVALVAILISAVIALGISRSQDITRQELSRSKAQESLQRDRVLTIINNMSDAVISTDMNGVIRIFNAACLNLLDTNNSLNSRHIDEILPLTDQEENKVSLFEEFQKSKVVAKRDDLNYKFSDGEVIRLELIFSPIRSSYSRSKKAETHDGYILIMRDVTKAKSLEEERDEFISVTSHELRTPITIAEGTISNVQVMMDHPDVTKQMMKDCINTAHDQVMFLANMVNDLSTLSRAERGVADKTEEIDVHELAYKMYEKYKDEAKQKKLHINLDLSPKLGKIQASRLYLEELLQNFITNAIKYTKSGAITIIVKNKGGVITFAVKDTGIGISKSDQQKIFNKFYRSEDYRTRETGGSGLGLYVAHKLARKLGTEIMVSSRLNFGSTFSFQLPESKQ